MRRRGLRKLIFGALALAAGACQSIIGANFDDVESKAAADSGPSCDSKQPPEPTFTTPQGGNIEFTLLASTIVFGEAETNKGTAPPETGYDLDHNCANRGDKPSCSPAAYTHGDPTDGVQGEDNAVAALVGGEYSGLKLDPPPVTSETLTKGVRDGKYSPLGLFHVSGYVGYDDDDVGVDWYIPLAAKFDPGGGFVPKLDGTDQWPVMSADETTGGPPLIFKAKRAYVANRQLVAFFDDGRVPFVNSYFQVHGVVLTAKLDSTTGTNLFSDTMLAGWGYSSELLKLLPGFTSELFGVPLCTNLSVYGGQIKPWLCGKLDMLEAPAKSGDPCNAFSMGLSFDTVPVIVGKTAPTPKTASCPPDSDPANDSCNTPGVVGDGGNPFDAGS